MGSLKIINEYMRKAVVATLTGDVATMRQILYSNNSPVMVAHWSGERRGSCSEGILDSFQLAQAMNDSLRFDELYKHLNVEAMWHLHRKMYPDTKRTYYDHFGFITWNWMNEPGDNPYFDEEDEVEFVKTGVEKRDICLTNYAIQHMEKEVVELLKSGASPYFLVTVPEWLHYDKAGVWYHSYFDVAPMLDVTELHAYDYWLQYIGDSLEREIASLSNSTLEEVVEGIFNVAACERILYITDKYIGEVARKKGERMMLEHLGKIHPILHKTGIVAKM